MLEDVLWDFLVKGGGLFGMCLYVFYVMVMDLLLVFVDLFVMECCYLEFVLLVDVLYGCVDLILNWCEYGDVFVKKLVCVWLKVVEGGYMLLVMIFDMMVDWLFEVVVVLVDMVM